MSHGIRIVDINDNGIEIAAKKGDALYQLIRPDFISEADDKSKFSLQTVRSEEDVHNLVYITRKELFITSHWRSTGGRWQDIFLVYLLHAAKQHLADTGLDSSWSPSEPAKRIAYDIRKEGGEAIFCSYVANVAHAMLASQYRYADHTLWDKLLNSFYHEFAVPAFEQLEANAQQQREVWLYSPTRTRKEDLANTAAKAYLAARQSA